MNPTRTSRSAVYSGDENAIGRRTRAGKAKATRKSARTALGDISNRRQTAGRACKKKKTVAPVKKQQVQEVQDDDMDICNEVEDLSLDLLPPLACDHTEDPQRCPKYIHDIMAYLREVEGRRHPSATYMTRQTDINARMREILIDWLVDVHLKFRLRLETLYLTVNVIDRFLELRAVSRTKLQLVGCTAMLIAAKYEEIYAPEVKDFVYISDSLYNREQILAMESIMLNTLKFNFTVPSLLRFGERFMDVAALDKKQRHLTNFFMELTLQNYGMVKYLPSQKAAAAVYLALLTTVGPGNFWTPAIAAHIQYSEDALKESVRELNTILTTENVSKYRAVRNKYSKTSFGAVATLTDWPEIPE